MKECVDLRPILSRLAEGEAGPEEALAAAHHLEDCTACRIVLAKERRLAEMLEQDVDDPVAVGEEFLARVMDRLPDGPPPRRRRRNRRGLTVATLLAVSLLGTGASVAWSLPGGGGGRSLLTNPIPPSADVWSTQLERGAGILMALFDTIGSGVDAGPVAGFGGGSLALALAVPVGLAALAVSGLLAVAAGRFLRV